ncbi:MAG: hypothetical protein WCK63_17910, partial [Betaproteobacteria bacterium]
LSPRPMASPFATGAFMQSGGAEGLWKRWEGEHAAVFVRNGRTEMLINKGNADWLGAHVTLIHPQIGVIGVSTESFTGALKTTWEVPWDDDFLFRGTPGWHWQVEGATPTESQPMHLKKGQLTLQGQGPGSGRLLLILAPAAGKLPAQPPLAQPFYLPFQRSLLGL